MREKMNHLCQIIWFSGGAGGNQHSLRWFFNNIPTVVLIFHKSRLVEERGWLMGLTTAVLAASLIRLCIKADNRSAPHRLWFIQNERKKKSCRASLQKRLFRASLNQVHPQSNWFKLCSWVFFHSITCGWRVESAVPEENRRKRGRGPKGPKKLTDLEKLKQKPRFGRWRSCAKRWKKSQEKLEWISRETVSRHWPPFSVLSYLPRRTPSLSSIKTH